MPPRSSWLWLGLGALGLIGLGVLVLGVDSRDQPSSNPETAATPVTGTVIAPLIISPTLVGQSIAWATQDSLQRISLEALTGSIETLASLPFVPDAVAWSPTGEQALVHDAQEGGTWNLVTFDGKKPVPLHGGVLHPAWSADGQRILYSFSGPTETPIAVAKPDGTDWEVLIPTTTPFERVWWPGSGTYALGRDFTSQPPRYVRIFVSSQRVETLARGTLDHLSAIPAPSGDRVVLEAESPSVPSLRLATLATGNVEPLGVTGLATLTAWQDEQTLVTIQPDKTVVSIDLAAKTATTQGSVVVTGTVEQLVGVTETQLIVRLQDGQLVAIPRP